MSAERTGGRAAGRHGVRVRNDHVLGRDAGGAGGDAVGAEADGAEFAGEGAGESFEPGLGADVSVEVVAACSALLGC